MQALRIDKIFCAFLQLCSAMLDWVRCNNVLVGIDHARENGPAFTKCALICLGGSNGFLIFTTAVCLSSNVFFLSFAAKQEIEISDDSEPKIHHQQWEILLAQWFRCFFEPFGTAAVPLMLASVRRSGLVSSEMCSSVASGRCFCWWSSHFPWSLWGHRIGSEMSWISLMMSGNCEFRGTWLLDATWRRGSKNQIYQTDRNTAVL